MARASSGPRNVGDRPAWVAARAAASRLRDVRVVGHHQEPGRLGGQRESLETGLGEGAVEGQGLEMQVDEDRIERVLDDPRVAPGCSGRDLRPLEQHDAAARCREVGRAGDADDPAADHDDVGRRIGGAEDAGHRGR